MSRIGFGSKYAMHPGYGKQHVAKEWVRVGDMKWELETVYHIYLMGEARPWVVITLPDIHIRKELPEPLKAEILSRVNLIN